MIAARAVAERNTNVVMGQDELYAKVQEELARLIEVGYGELHVIISSGGKSVDIISAPRNRIALIQNNEGDTYTITDK